MHNMRIRKGSTSDILLILFILFSATMIAINISLGYPTKLNNAIAALSLLVSIYLCYVYRHNIGLFLVMLFIAYTNYSVAVGVYCEPSLRPGFMYDQFLSSSTYGVGITCIYIFEITTVWLSRYVIKNPESISSWNNAANENYAYNNIIALAAPIVYVLLFMLTFRSGEDGARGGSSSIGEYRTVIAIIGCYYCGRKKIYKWIWTAIIGVTSILVMMSGNRADLFGSAIFLIIFWYADFFDYKKVLLLLPAAIIVFAAIGFLRGNFSFSNLDVGNTVSILLGDRLTYEGAIFAYVPALSVIELTGHIGGAEKINMLWQHVKYIFSFGGANPDLSAWSRNYYIHYWGFVSPIYFYFWTGYLGPVLYAALVNAYNKAYQKSILKGVHGFKGKLGYILSLFFMSVVARWYTYGPMALLRGMFICTVAFCVVYAFDLLVKQRADRFRK